MTDLEKEKEALLIQVKRYLVIANVDASKIDENAERVAQLLKEIVDPVPPFSEWV